MEDQRPPQDLSHISRSNQTMEDPRPPPQDVHARVRCCALFGCPFPAEEGNYYCCAGHALKARDYSRVLPYTVSDGLLDPAVTTLRMGLSLIQLQETPELAIGISRIADDPLLFHKPPWECNSLNLEYLPRERSRSWVFFYDSNPIFKQFTSGEKTYAWQRKYYHLQSYGEGDQVTTIPSSTSFFVDVNSTKWGQDVKWRLWEVLYGNRSMFCLTHDAGGLNTKKEVKAQEFSDQLASNGDEDVRRRSKIPLKTKTTSGVKRSRKTVDLKQEVTRTIGLEQLTLPVDLEEHNSAIKDTPFKKRFKPDTRMLEYHSEQPAIVEQLTHLEEHNSAIKDIPFKKRFKPDTRMLEYHSEQPAIDVEQPAIVIVDKGDKISDEPLSEKRPLEIFLDCASGSGLSEQDAEKLLSLHDMNLEEAFLSWLDIKEKERGVNSLTMLQDFYKE